MLSCQWPLQFLQRTCSVAIYAENHVSLAEEMHVHPVAKTFGITDNIREQPALGAQTASQGRAEDSYGSDKFRKSRASACWLLTNMQAFQCFQAERKRAATHPSSLFTTMEWHSKQTSVFAHSSWLQQVRNGNVRPSIYAANLSGSLSEGSFTSMGTTTLSSAKRTSCIQRKNQTIRICY